MAEDSKCSFCGRTKPEARVLLAGASDENLICDHCVSNFGSIMKSLPDECRVISYEPIVEKKK